MVAAKCSDEEFIRDYQALGPSGLAHKYDTNLRTVFARRRRIEKLRGIRLRGPNGSQPPTLFSPSEFPGRLELQIDTGLVLVGSDAHYWNIDPSPAHRAFLKLIKDLKPRAVVLNGDVLDGATISRHPPINWERRPSLIQELEACKERLHEIEQAAGKAEKVWTLGNHDARYETRLATVAPEYANVHGVHLKDHFPYWAPAWSLWINDDVVIKHRFKGGIHATHNNTLWAGKTTVTGHLHSLKITPHSDYNGTRWGIDDGTLADPWGPQFVYMEDNPRSWRSGFVVLTFHDGELLWPEVVYVRDQGSIVFRGRVIDV